MIGPVALVKDKTEKSYSHLFKALVSELPSLAQSVKACGSDGEINLEKALESSFPQAYRVRCANHLFNDIREKAKQIGLPRSKVECSVDELRTVCLTSTRESGPRDLVNLIERWQQSADPGYKEPTNRFCSYVSRYIIPVIRDRAISDNSKLAGLPQFADALYTQNASESANAVLKRWTGFKEKDVDAFILDLKELVTREEDDVARALIGIESPYEVLQEVSALVSKNREYLVNPNLTEEERKKRKAKLLTRDFSSVLDKVDGFQPLGKRATQQQPKDEESKEPTGMSKLDALTELGFSEPMISGMKQKAHNLIAGGLVTRAFSGNESRFVKSYSSNKPHLVQPHKKLGYMCDESCLQYKANKVCSHTVAAAYDNSQLEDHINRLLKSRPEPSLEALASGKPDAGKKKSKQRKRVRRKSPQRVFEDANRSTSYPWRESSHPFVIKRKGRSRVRKCPGCREEFDEFPPVLDLIVIHREKDWRAGTDKITPVANPRGYHLNLKCISARHPQFLKNSSTSTKLIIDFAQTKEEELLILQSLSLEDMSSVTLVENPVE